LSIWLQRKLILQDMKPVWANRCLLSILDQIHLWCKHTYAMSVKRGWNWIWLTMFRSRCQSFLQSNKSHKRKRDWRL